MKARSRGANGNDSTQALVRRIDRFFQKTQEPYGYAIGRLEFYRQRLLNDPGLVQRGLKAIAEALKAHEKRLQIHFRPMVCLSCGSRSVAFESKTHEKGQKR
jgi:hypothetical protein